MKTIEIEILDEENKVIGTGVAQWHASEEISFNPCIELPAICFIREKGTEQKFARDRPGNVWTRAIEGHYEVKIVATSIVYVKGAESKAQAIQYAKDELNLIDFGDVTAEVEALCTEDAVHTSKRHADAKSEAP